MGSKFSFDESGLSLPPLALEHPGGIARQPGANGLWAYHPEEGEVNLYVEKRGVSSGNGGDNGGGPDLNQAKSDILTDPLHSILPPPAYGGVGLTTPRHMALGLLSVLDSVSSGKNPLNEPGTYKSKVKLESAPPPEADNAKRFGGTSAGWYLGGSADAIGFEVDVSVLLTGIYMYGDNKNSKFTMKVSIHEGLSNRGNECIYGPDTIEYEGDGSNAVEVDLNSDVMIEAGSKYCIVACITGPQSNYGNDGQASSESENSTATVKWLQTDCSDNGTGVGSGQIGGIKFLPPHKGATPMVAEKEPLPEKLPASFAVGSDWSTVSDLFELSKEACDSIYARVPGSCEITREELERLKYVAKTGLKLMRCTIICCPRDESSHAELLTSVLTFLEKILTLEAIIEPSILNEAKELYLASFGLFFPGWALKKVVLLRLLEDTSRGGASALPASRLLSVFITGIMATEGCAGGLGFCTTGGVVESECSSGVESMSSLELEVTFQSRT